METRESGVPISEPAGPELGELIARTKECLRLVGYRPTTILAYERVWERFARYCQEAHGAKHFSTEMVQGFVESILECRECPPSQNLRRRMVTTTRMLAEVATTGGYCPRFLSRRQEVCLPDVWRAKLETFQRFCADDLSLCPDSVERKTKGTKRFIQFCLSRGVVDAEGLSPRLVHDFMASQVSLRSSTVAGRASELRSFLGHMRSVGEVSQTLVDAVPRVRQYAQDRIPTVWKTEEVARLLGAVDRGSPTGKRNYAILLLAARTGMRVGDIRGLTLDNLNWQTSSIQFTQTKTQQPQILPLSGEVGEAIIDYLKNGRPASSAREVFLRAKPPLTAFHTHDKLYHIIDFYRKRAGLHSTTHRYHGFHSLRHTLASRLLEVGTPIETISGILGHTSIDSTRIYTKVDIALLRRAALELEEFGHE